ncbi:MAG: hypothetical protein C0501_19810 [Isosphaera sp.]|nr:hypothetical protein [Isosphaera sp.]
MSTRRRIKALEKKAGGSWRVHEFWEKLAAEVRRRRAEILAITPEDLRGAVAAAHDRDVHGPFREFFAVGTGGAFAPWAPSRPAGYLLPRALIEFMLHDDREWWVGHTCGRCGLKVPLLWRSSLDPNPPAELKVFPDCPACGWKTSYHAYSGPDREDGSPFLV